MAITTRSGKVLPEIYLSMYTQVDNVDNDFEIVDSDICVGNSLVESEKLEDFKDRKVDSKGHLEDDV